jgi:hypothetical protein
MLLPCLRGVWVGSPFAVAGCSRNDERLEVRRLREDGVDGLVSKTKPIRKRITPIEVNLPVTPLEQF